MIAWAMLACAPLPTPEAPEVPEAADPRAAMLAGGLLEPMAVGFEFAGIIRADGSISGYSVGGEAYDPSMKLIVTDQGFFGTGDESLTCAFWMIPFEPEPLICDLPNDDGAGAWNAYEATFDIDATDCDDVLDPVDYAQLVAAFDGMRLGISFGPMTPYLESAMDATDLATFGGALSAMYVSIVDPDGSWVGEDWTIAVSFALDPVTGEPIVDPVTHRLLAPLADASTNDVTLDEAYINTSAYWYQDFVLMDFPQLDDVNGVACDCSPDPGDDGPGPDSDGDGLCDVFDVCPLDDPDDTDGDGVCDADDPCPLDLVDDTDLDGVCDSDDLCPIDNPDDTDGDGVCESEDVCPVDNPDDTDGDGVCDSDDPCPADSPDDTDGDGVCDSDDVCPADPTNPDRDGDGVCDPDDPCPDDAQDDPDGDGLCGSPIPVESGAGCGCDGTSGAAPSVLALCAVLGVVRRRARAPIKASHP